MPHTTAMQAWTEIIMIERTEQYSFMVLDSDDSTHKLPT